MRTMRLWVVAGAALVGAMALAAVAGNKLYINGKAASSSVKVINGTAYVPISDVAKAMGMSVQKRADGYSIGTDGGHGQIANKFTGKLGDEIFTGKWKFTVLKVRHADSYKIAKSHLKSFSDANENEEFIVVDCRVKNGTPKKDELVFENWDGINTALTDSGEQTYQPIKYDVAESEYAPVGVTVLPGSAINFTLVFKVPKDTVEKDLIFTAMRYDFRASFDQKKDPPQDIRVDLTPTK